MLWSMIHLKKTYKYVKSIKSTKLVEYWEYTSKCTCIN